MATTLIGKSISNLLRGFLRNDRGNMTMLMGLASIPVIAAAGMAIDYARISRVHDEIQLIADGAALAAAGARNLTGTAEEKKSQRVAIATSYLTSGLARVTDTGEIGAPTVVATSSKVTIEVEASVKGSLINVLDARKKEDAGFGQGNGGNEDGASGGRVYDLTVNSEASWNDGMSYLCILALNESDSKSLEIQGTADIFAPNCAVWVNSSSNSGLYENGNATLTAKKNCVRGGYSGSHYYPDMPKTGATDCPKYVDPLATKFATDYATAWAAAPNRTGWTSPIGGTATLQPGKYAGGITVNNGGRVTLSPGVYFMVGGKMNIKAGGEVYGNDGVTIIMTDATAISSTITNSSAKLTVQAKANLSIKAPSSGPFAGIAIAQHPNSITGTLKPDANNIQGGGIVNITGIVYYPKQKLYITGGGTGTVSTPEKIAVDDPLFAIVADKIMVEGNGQLRVGGAADNEAAGLPALPSQGAGETIVSLH